MKGRKASPALAAHMAQEAAARLIAWAFFAAAIVAGAALGKGPALALGLMGGAFWLARPGPTEELDREAGRGR